MTVVQLQEVFVNHADGTQRKSMELYMKNHFVFLGIPKPKRTVLQKPFLTFHKNHRSIDWQLVEELWDLKEREFQYVAIEYLILTKKYLVPEDLIHIQKIILQKPWWDTVDLMASHLLGFLILHFPEVKAELVTWNSSNHLWLQRSVILSQLKCKQKTDLVFLEEVIIQNLHSKEFFINKAIGWMLRELAKTHESIVKSWLSRHSFAPLTVREASKHFN
jgi:3-methyladenine DNA glycosylase AlkD